MRQSRRKMIKYLGILLICIVSIVGVSLCTNARADVPPMKSVVKEVNGISVSIDPRIEALSVVQMLGNYNETYGLITPYNFTYRREVMDYFRDYAVHPAVKLFEEMSMKGFSYDAPPTLMLYLDETFRLDRTLTVEDYLVRRAGGKGKMNQFIQALEQFVLDTDFEKFYTEQKPAYEVMIQNTVEVLETESYISELEAYYGMEKASYNIILAPLHRPGGFGPQIIDGQGNMHVFNIQGTMGEIDDIPVFGDKAMFDYMVWHEFSHSFVNPLTAQYKEEVERSAELMKPIVKQMHQESYQTWETALNEHIIRTVTARRQMGEGTRYDHAIKSEKGKGFAYIEILSDKLAEYEANRDAYTDFTMFYPQILKMLNEVAAKGLADEFYKMAFEGPINRALQMSGDFVIITPTQEDASVQADIEMYCEGVANMLMNNVGIKSTIVSDTEALNQDFADKNLIVYGTMEGNLWLKAYEEALPFRIEEDKMITNQVYDGDNLRLISALPHPDSKTQSLLIYTAQKSADIVNINNVNHGMTDYVISKGEDIIVQNNYIKDEGGWLYE